MDFSFIVTFLSAVIENYLVSSINDQKNMSIHHIFHFFFFFFCGCDLTNQYEWQSHSFTTNNASFHVAWPAKSYGIATYNISFLLASLANIYGQYRRPQRLFAYKSFILVHTDGPIDVYAWAV